MSRRSALTRVATRAEGCRCRWNFDLFGGDSVVLVDDGDDAIIEQRGEGVARVEIAAAVFGIGAGEKDLADADAVDVEDALPLEHKAGLADGGKELFVDDGRR